MKEASEYVVGDQVVSGEGLGQREGNVVEVFNNPDHPYVMVQWPGHEKPSHEFYRDIRPA